MSDLLLQLSLALIFFCVVCGLAVRPLTWAGKLHMPMLPYPPGPRPGLFLGNQKDILTKHAWIMYTEWRKKYGNIIYLKTSRQPMIILNAMEDAVELLDRRSRKYSSRPTMAMHKLMGFGKLTAFRVYGPEWRRHRRVFQQSFKPESARAYRPYQTKKMNEMLLAFLQTPDEFVGHIKTLAGAIIMSITYDYNVAPENDHYVKLAESTRPAFAMGSSPKWLVNSFPVLRHIPSWMPGANFKSYALSTSRTLTEIVESPFKYALTSAVPSEETHTSMIREHLSKCDSPMELRMLQEAAASGYGAGVGTTFSSIMVFLVAMIMFPDVQKKAQQEVDRITGRDRLPQYSDQAFLPYIQAVIREVIRWKPIVPLGLPHANDEDDTYNGYHIPKNSVVHPNVWAMTRDPEKYKDPESFEPSRFLTETGALNDDDMTYAFGFGRRICPGRHLAIATMWLAVSTILASFDIGHKKDEAGNIIPLDITWTDGLSSYPLPFQCSITPRSEAAKQLVLEACPES